MQYNFCVFVIAIITLISCVIGEEGLSADYVQVDKSGVVIRILPYGKNSLRAQISPTRIVNNLPGALITQASPQSANVYGLDSPDTDPKNLKFPIRKAIVIVNGNIKATIGVNGLITFSRVSDSKVLLVETSRIYSTSPYLNDTYTWNVTYASDSDEAIYGLGQHPQTGRLNNKGSTFVFRQSLEYDISMGTQITIPFYASNKGYGYLWNLPSYGNFSSTTSNTSWSSESAHQLDFWVTTTTANSTNPYGDIMRSYVDATGHAPKLPYVASGFIQSNNRYRNQTAVLDVARGHVARGLPISMIVIDRIRTDPYGNFQYATPICWPNPNAMNEELEALGIKSIVSVWPLIQFNSINVAAFLPYVIKCPGTQDFCVVPPLPVYTYDATIPAARQLIWDKVKEGLFDKGTHSYFLDSAEPVKFSTNARYFYSIGPEETVGMIWSLYHIQAFREGQISAGVADDSVNIVRSAWAGAQRYAPIVWSGDVNSTFESLSDQVRVGLNMAMSGIPFWTTDIGGYQNGDITTAYWRELAIRWFQYGAFCPIFRSHGFRMPLQATDLDICMRSGASNEIWNFGDEAYEAIRTVMLIRDQLRSYVVKHLNIASATGTPIMRPLFFDFPNDLDTYSHEDQFMFGPLYLVAPVLQYGARSRSVYFPKIENAVWVHWFTKDIYVPGTTVDVAAPINTFPLFYKQKVYSSSNSTSQLQQQQQQRSVDHASVIDLY